MWMLGLLGLLCLLMLFSLSRGPMPRFNGAHCTHRNRPVKGFLRFFRTFSETAQKLHNWGGYTSRMVTLHAKVGDAFRAGVVVHAPAQADSVAAPRDLAGVTITTRLRLGPTSNSPLAGTQLDIGNRTDAKGSFELTLPSAHTLAPGTYHFALMLEEDGARETIAEGVLAVSGSIA